MIVIVCHPHDEAALWLHGELRHAGICGPELVSVEQLVFSRSVVHRMTSSGDAGAIRLADGRVIRSETIATLINRVQYLPTQHFAGASTADRLYATAELHAFMLAWLNSAGGRVFNPPRPLDLAGGTFDPGSLLCLAEMAGLPTVTWRAASAEPGTADPPVLLPTHTVVVFDARVFGPRLPEPLQEGCRRLGALLGVPLLEIGLHRSAETSWMFATASGLVDFRRAGRLFMAGFAEALKGAIGA